MKKFLIVSSILTLLATGAIACQKQGDKVMDKKGDNKTTEVSKTDTDNSAPETATQKASIKITDPKEDTTKAE